MQTIETSRKAELQKEIQRLDSELELVDSEIHNHHYRATAIVGGHLIMKMQPNETPARARQRVEGRTRELLRERDVIVTRKNSLLAEFARIGETK